VNSGGTPTPERFFPLPLFLLQYAASDSLLDDKDLNYFTAYLILAQDL